ncbi:MAG: LysE family translocator [Thiomicrorhabdus chilensis]|uniref:LysE family translocator n=1 Tax=Thiomicrorhabdus chilensis TaxID=63656 RepID=UPI00299F08AF|nr:LysE family translocator [Thiomicrorhabdus chilensis]MDX1347498.1 LysE family translocator [Thiomicrorhabdus chilensis]
MSLVEILGLFTVMVALALVPSTSVALIVARSSSAGFSNGSAVAAGIVFGDLVFVFLAVFGMAALAEVVGSFFLILRYLAGGYLIWFGISLMRSKASLQLKDSGRSVSKLSSSFFSGLLLTLGDVKVIFFYASLFPAFVDLATIGTLDIAIIAVITIIAVGGVKLSYAYFARIVVLSVTNHRAERAFKVTAGSLMVGAGSYLIAKA